MKTEFHLWPTYVRTIEIPQDVCAEHNLELVRLVKERAGYSPNVDINTELRAKNLETVDNAAVRWLVFEVGRQALAYVGLNATIDVALRGVVLRYGQHINTHTESHESDLMIAYWPSGWPEDIGSHVNRVPNRAAAPPFVIEDPSRSLSDLRLPREQRHSVMIAPRPGMMVLGPAHLPHNLWPYLGREPFIHIVAQVRITWPDGYEDRY